MFNKYAVPQLLAWLSLWVLLLHPVSFGQSQSPSMAELMIQGGHFDNISAIEFSTDGKFVLTGSKDRSAVLWDFETKRQLRRFSNHSSSVSAVSFSRDGNRILTASNRDVYLWETETGKLIRQYRIPSQSFWVETVVFSASGYFIAVASGCGRSIYMWDTRKGTSDPLWINHNYSGNVSFSPDDEYVVVGGGYCNDGKLAVLYSSNGGLFQELENSQAIKGLNGHKRFDVVSYTSDGQVIFANDNDGNVYLWSSTSGTELHRLHHEEQIRTLAITEDKTKLLAVGVENVFSWQLSVTGEKQLSSRLLGRKGLKEPQSDSSYPVTVAAISPDFHYVLTATDEYRDDARKDYRVHLWDLREVFHLGYFEGLISEAFAANFLQIGRASCRERVCMLV